MKAQVYNSYVQDGTLVHYFSKMEFEYTIKIG